MARRRRGLLLLEGTSGATQSLAGTDAGTSTLSGTLTFSAALAGSDAGSSTTVGALSVFKTLAGTDAGSSTLFGTFGAVVTVAGTDAGSSTLTGALSRQAALAGVDAGTSVLVGAVRVSRPLAGVDGGASTLVGALALVVAAPTVGLPTTVTIVVQGGPAVAGIGSSPVGLPDVALFIAVVKQRSSATLPGRSSYASNAGRRSSSFRLKDRSWLTSPSNGGTRDRS
jgi:hypothetical protein